MNKLNRIALLTFTLVIALAGVGLATPSSLPDFPFGSKIEVTPIPDKTGPVTLVFSFRAPPAHWPPCDSMRVAIAIEGELIYDGRRSFAVELTDSLRYSCELALTIPPGDESTPSVSILSATVACGESAFTTHATFIVLGEAVRYVYGLTGKPPEDFFPELAPPSKKSWWEKCWESFWPTRKEK